MTISLQEHIFVIRFATFRFEADTVLKAAVAKAVKNAEQRSAGSWGFSEKTDWVKFVNDIMQSEYQYGDLKGYMEWKKFLGFLEK